MLSWLPTFPIVLATLGALFGPGLLLLWIFGLRRLNLLALSAPVSVAFTGSVAVLLGLLSVPFTPLSWSVSLAICALAAVSIRFLLKQKTGYPLELESNDRWPGGAGKQNLASRLTVIFAVVFPTAIISLRYMAGFGNPENISQTFDNIFHLNATKFIMDTGNGSTLTIGNLTEESRGIYPAGLHDVMALVAMLSGGSVPAVVNVTSIAVAALVWPLSCYFLMVRLFGNRKIAITVAGILLAGFSTFPYSMVAFGVLYPYHLGLALVPVAIGLTVEVLKPSSTAKFGLEAFVYWLAVVVGLSLAHPSMTIALLLFSSPVVVAKLITMWKMRNHSTHQRSRLRIWFALSIAYLVLAFVAYVKIRPDLGAAGWLPTQTNAQAVGEVLTSGLMGATAAWTIFILTLLGLYRIGRNFKKYWWIGAIYVLGGTLFVVVSGFNPGFLRTFVTGVWYTDPPRIAAIVPITTLPVAVLGGMWVLRRTQLFIARYFSRTREVEQVRRVPFWTARHATSIATLILVVLIGLSTQGGTLANVQGRLKYIYETDANSFLVDADERALISEVSRYVPKDGVIVGDPLAGASLVYALGDRKALAPHFFGERTPDEELLLDHWDEAAYNPEVCGAAKRLNAYWALDFGREQVPPGDKEKVVSGVRDITDTPAPGVSVLAEVGDKRLLELSVCKG